MLSSSWTARVYAAVTPTPIPRMFIAKACPAISAVPDQQIPADIAVVPRVKHATVIAD